MVAEAMSAAADRGRMQTVRRRTPGASAWLLLAILLAGCASMAIDETEALVRAGRFDDALMKADELAKRYPDDPRVRAALTRVRDKAVGLVLASAELALAQGRVDEASILLRQAQALDPQRPATIALDAQLTRAREQRARAVAPAPASSQAADAPGGAPTTLGAQFHKPIALEFRDAPLRQVFESMARSSGVNFVFDKDVRADSRISLYLQAVTIDEAMRIILATQQLDRKVLNDRTVLVYPNTPAKQREYQELVTRSLYLVNADAKTALAMVRTLAKTRDMHADERLNALIVRDTPEVVRQVEQLVATIDMPEPEVTLAVEVMEVATDRLEALGISWPSSISYGIPGSLTQVPISADGFRGLVANPALVAELRGTAGSTNLLANPTIRARQREKAKVQIGDKLPVFTTTAVVNAGVSTSVTFLEVGLKLDIEPSVQLDGDVVIKLALEVSNVVREVQGPQGSLAYQVGTRLTSTSLRLKDGQTQVLAGLISDEDRKRSTGLPRLSELPLLGKLFGVQSGTRVKTEIVMLITPRIVRSLAVPDRAAATLVSGTDAQPGAEPFRLRPSARAGIAPALGGPAGTAPAPSSEPPAAEAPSAEAPADGLTLGSSAAGRVGGTVSVTLSNMGGEVARGELVFDATQLQPASGAAEIGTAGRWPFEVPARGQSVLVMRVLPAAAGQTVSVQARADVPVQGTAQIVVAPARETAR